MSCNAKTYTCKNNVCKSISCGIKKQSGQTYCKTHEEIKEIYKGIDESEINEVMNNDEAYEIVNEEYKEMNEKNLVFYTEIINILRGLLGDLESVKSFLVADREILESKLQDSKLKENETQMQIKELEKKLDKKVKNEQEARQKAPILRELTEQKAILAQKNIEIEASVANLNLKLQENTKKSNACDESINQIVQKIEEVTTEAVNLAPA